MNTSNLSEVERLQAERLFVSMEHRKAYLELDRGTVRAKCIYFDDSPEEEREREEPWVATKRISGMERQERRFSQFTDAFAWVLQ